jgi:hypothetical protein
LKKKNFQRFVKEKFEEFPEHWENFSFQAMEEEQERGSKHKRTRTFLKSPGKAYLKNSGMQDIMQILVSAGMQALHPPAASL